MTLLSKSIDIFALGPIYFLDVQCHVREKSAKYDSSTEIKNSSI